MKKFISVIAVVFLTAALFSSCVSSKNSGDNMSTAVTESSFLTSADTQSTAVFADNTKNTTGEDSQKAEPTTAATAELTASSDVPDNNDAETVNAFESSGTEVETTSQYKKTGEMEFSDSKDNKYLAAVVKKYGVDAKNLAAIYTVPDNDGNMVLRFDGTTDKNGKLVRTADTLTAIYTVKKSLECKCASKNSAENEYSDGEMKVMFLTTERFILPKFESQLNG